MAKEKLLNMRVSDEWLEDRKEKMRDAGYETLTAYILAMVNLGEVTLRSLHPDDGERWSGLLEEE